MEPAGHVEHRLPVGPDDELLNRRGQQLVDLAEPVGWLHAGGHESPPRRAGRDRPHFGLA